MQAAKDMEKVLDVSLSQIAEEFPLPSNPPQYSLLSTQFLRRHGRDLFSCSATWFLVDIVFYSSNLFQSLIYHSFIDHDGTKKLNAYDEAFEVAKLQAIVAACSTIPGYVVTVYFIDRIGRVKIQLLGFFFMSLVYFAIGIVNFSYLYFCACVFLIGSDTYIGVDSLTSIDMRFILIFSSFTCRFSIRYTF